MKTGRFINTLQNNVLAYFQTSNCAKLLSQENARTVWNMKQSGANYFPDDLAVAYSEVWPEFDKAGRIIMANDTVIVKFEASEILSFLKNGIVERIRKVQQRNGGDLANPLPDIEV
jgi:hypothetical protein